MLRRARTTRRKISLKELTTLWAAREAAAGTGSHRGAGAEKTLFLSMVFLAHQLNSRSHSDAAAPGAGETAAAAVAQQAGPHRRPLLLHSSAGSGSKRVSAGADTGRHGALLSRGSEGDDVELVL